MTLINDLLNLPTPLLNHWGYLVILLAALLETAPLFGMLIPGQLIIVIGGLLVKLKILEIGDVILIAALGAIIGDCIAFYLGHRYGYSFITKFGKYFFLKEERFNKIKPLITENLGKTLIVGRFNSLTRALAPFLAGASKITFLKFLTYNIIGGFCWSVVFVVIGYLFGASYETLAPRLGHYVLLATIISIILIYIYKYLDRNKHIFAHYHLYALVINISSLLLFAKLIEDVLSQKIITKWDIWLNQIMSTYWQPLLNKIMLNITDIGSPSVLIILSTILLVYLLFQKKIYYSLLLLFSMAGGLVLELLMKYIIQRPRPLDGLLTISSYSFPSGHAIMSLIFFSLIIYFFRDSFHNNNLKKLFLSCNIILIFLISFSRVYLGVHWLSDILAGWLLGLFWLTLIIIILQITQTLLKTTIIAFKELIKKITNLPSH